VRFSELLHFHNHQNKHVFGYFQYYDLINKRIKCAKILFLPHYARHRITRFHELSYICLTFLLSDISTSSTFISNDVHILIGYEIADKNSSPDNLEEGLMSSSIPFKVQLTAKVIFCLRIILLHTMKLFSSSTFAS
jgi:hypothetical protein